MKSSPPDQSAWDPFVSGGEMGEIMRAFDWSRTPLGPIASWPVSLVTAVGIVMNSRYPMLLWWGPELRQIYNDAYRPVLGGKHPRSVGQPGAEVWSEIWDILGPRADAVRRGAGATWDEDLLLPMDRYGFVEETYFTFSYSPVPDPLAPGTAAGVLVTCSETTPRVLGERRLRTLRELGARSARAESAEAACRIAAAAITQEPRDVPFALIYLHDEEEQEAWLAGAVGVDVPPALAEVALADAHAGDASIPLAEVLRGGRPVVVDDVGARVARVVAEPWHEPVHTAVALPIPSSQPGQPAGVLVAGISPRLALDDRYRDFLEVAAGQVGTAVSNARAYEAERRRVEALAELNQAKTQFFSNVSHEFRTPLALMLGPVEELLASRTTDLTDAVAEQLEIVHRNALRLLKLVNALLDFSRIEAGRGRASFVPTALGTLTGELASSFRSAMTRAGLRFVVDCADADGHAAPVYVDHASWEKIVLNLLSNAFKHTFEGEIAVRLRFEAQAAVLEVRDTGVGIPERELPRVFERFHQVPNARRRNVEGSGIGLALVQELVRLHGGTIELASEEGVGTTATVRIPLGRAHLPADQVQEEGAASAPSGAVATYVEELMRMLPGPAAPARGEERLGRLPGGRYSHAAPLPAIHGSGARVLLADDNADMRAYITRLLRASGHVVEAVPDGQAALEAARARRPEVVIADVMMPKVEGFALLRALRAEPDTATIPVILLSARAGEEARVQGLDAGADDYLVKPFSARELTARVEAHVRLARLRAETAAALGESRRVYETLLANLPGMAYRCPPDPPWRLTFASEGARDLTAYSPDEFLAGAVAWMSIVHPDDAARVEQIVEHALAAGEPFEMIYRIRRRDGEERWVLDRGRGVADALGRVVSLEGFVGDLTEVKHAEAERARLHAAAEEARKRAEEARRRADEANRAKSDFLAVMSHELRTPLNAIAGYVQLLEMELHGPLTAEQREFLARIERSERHLLRLINDVLNLARIESGRIEYRVEPLPLADAVTHVLPMIEPQIAEKALGLTVEIPRTLTAPADREKLQQILLNLLTNAVKFTPTGGRIRIDALERVVQGDGASPTRVVELRVSDTGVGIPAEKLEAIFEPFVQVDVSHTRTSGGSGLGLAISRDLARGMGGDLSATSMRGAGSTFTLTLPEG